MDERQQVAWLHRRAGFGLDVDSLAAAQERGAGAELDRMLDPDSHGVPADPDPWANTDLDPENRGARNAVVDWLRHLVATNRPYQARRTWMLHGWLVSSLAKVPIPEFMVGQIRLYIDAGGGSYPDLLRAVTVDRAMLGYLDGRTSTAAAPNENYGRELLELFALGVGNYTEDDVMAAARSLTGWVIGRDFDEARFVPRRHDDTPQTLLGTGGVHDVDTVVDAVVAHPAHPRFVAERIATEYLGDTEEAALDGVVEHLAAIYEREGRRLDAVIRAALELGLDGRTSTSVLAPVPWLVMSLRSTGADLTRLGRGATDQIRAMGQLPLVPPDVSGWPSGAAWFTASSLIARTNVAAAVAAATPGGAPIRVAIEAGDIDLAAELLGLTEPFGAATTAAIRTATDPIEALALALVSPEHLLS